MYKILSYCAEIGFEKVLVIDPHLIRTLGRVPVINPFTKHKEASVANIMDTIRILFKTKDASETPRIERYLPAILSLLWNAEAPLSDALYFTDFHNPYFRTMRNQIIEKTDPIDRHRIEIEHIFSSSGLF